MSMTREEIIKEYEEAVAAHAAYAAAGIKGAEKSYELFKAGLDALRPVSREQVEKMAGEWVQDINKGPAVFYCSSCGENFEIHSYEFQKYRFCPFCMSPMTDEAEETVMRRLEALKDGSTTD